MDVCLYIPMGKVLSVQLARGDAATDVLNRDYSEQFGVAFYCHGSWKSRLNSRHGFCLCKERLLRFFVFY